MGQPPEWYRKVQAARYLGVAPWDEELTEYWIGRALIAMGSENFAEDYFIRRAKLQAKANAQLSR